MDNILAYMKL